MRYYDLNLINHLLALGVDVKKACLALVIILFHSLEAEVTTCCRVNQSQGAADNAYSAQFKFRVSASLLLEQFQSLDLNYSSLSQGR